MGSEMCIRDSRETDLDKGDADADPSDDLYVLLDVFTEGCEASVRVDGVCDVDSSEHTDATPGHLGEATRVRHVGAVQREGGVLPVFVGLGAATFQLEQKLLAIVTCNNDTK